MATPRKTPAATKAVSKTTAKPTAKSATVTPRATAAARATTTTRTPAAARTTATPRPAAPRAASSRNTSAKAAPRTRTSPRRSPGRDHGRHVRPDPSRAPGGGERGGGPVRASTRSCSSPPASRGRRVGEVSPAEDRYLMTVIATASNPRFHVSRVDIDRDGPTYTVDTLRDLRGRVRAEGASCSSSPARTRWRRSCPGRTPTEMFELAHFVGVTRPGFVLSDDHLPADTVSLVQVPAMAISSTDCRRGSPPASRSGTWCRTGWCSTSLSDISTAEPSCPVRVTVRRRSVGRRRVRG